MRLQDKIKTIFEETTVADGEAHPGTSRRYVARGFPEGGGGWGVWDNASERYLSLVEVGRLTDEEVREELPR